MFHKGSVFRGKTKKDELISQDLGNKKVDAYLRTHFYI